MNFLIQLLLALNPSLFKDVKEQKPPHIVFIFADDLGWNDVSFHGATDIPTPNIDALGLNGIILNNYYGEWLCTPSRGALLSGMYPIRLGLQHSVIVAGEASALPLNIATLPQHLKRLGYATHIVGKWHLGYQNKVYLPAYRGFDTFFGYLNGFIDYYDYSHDSYMLTNDTIYFGIDLYNGTEHINNFRSKYATEVFADHARNIIMEHDISKPFFLYLPHLAIHTGNLHQPLQAPPEIVSKFNYIKDPKRRIHAAKISALDNAVGSVFEALSHKDMLEDSIVIFVSDNGGQINPLMSGYSSNFPLRGNKYTPWEGGIRLPAVVWSPLFNLTQPLVSKQLMHVSDWLPTLYSAAGGKISYLGKVDGINMWETITKNVSSPRKDLLNVMDPIYGISAFRDGDFKLVNGSTGTVNRWHGPTSSEYIGKPPSMYSWIFERGSVIRDILMRKGWWISQDPDSVYKDAKITCDEPPDNDTKTCMADEEPCLFNLKEDPCETNNLASEYPEVVEKMMDRIRAYEEEQVKPQFKDADPRADPLCHNFAYVPWLDPEYYTECMHAN